MQSDAKQVFGYAICLAAFAFVVWSFYPGLMTADSIAALAQGRSNVYGDINAPLMSWIWGRLDSVVSGPSLIFVMHLAIFWAACALFWKATSRRSIWLGLALVIFGLLPHILAQTVVVWKDVALGVSLFAAVALVYVARITGSRLALFISPLFLFYGYAARLNAFPAVLPIAVWTGFVALEIFEFRKRWWTALLLGVGYLAVISIGVYIMNRALTDGRTDHPFQQVYLYDLAALSVEKNQPLFPAYIREHSDFSFDVVRSRYNERSVSDLIFPNIPNEGDRPPLKLTSNADEVTELRNVWRVAVADDPAALLTHKGRVFSQLIGLNRSVTAPYVAEGFGSNPAEFRGGENLGFAVLMKYFGAFRRPFPQTFFHRAVIWMIGCTVLLLLALRRRFRKDWDLVGVLSMSSLFFILAYLPTTPSTEFRYLFWPAIASALSVIFGIYLWWSERKGRVTRIENET